MVDNKKRIAAAAAAMAEEIVRGARRTGAYVGGADEELSHFTFDGPLNLPLIAREALAAADAVTARSEAKTDHDWLRTGGRTFRPTAPKTTPPTPPPPSRDD